MSNKPTYAQDEAPRLLDGNNLKAIAKYMKSDSCRNVFVMTGAGISTSAGIPDFRTPGTGLYSNLAKLKLPYAEAVFELNFFRENPYPFYVVAKELWPGRYRPTLAHAFIKVLHSKNLLHTSFTQNVDMLERRAGVPPEKIIEAHGSYATQTCIDCKEPYDSAKMKEAIKKLTPPQCEKCKGYVKSDIVFFGEAMPSAFYNSIHRLRGADLLIVMGTSLQVYPFAALVDLVPPDCPRLLLNMDEVGNFDRPDDVVCLGKCDDLVKELCLELGWEKELDEVWEATADCIDWDEDVVPLDKSGKETVDKELEKITSGIEKALDLTEKPSAVEIEEQVDDKSGSEPDSPRRSDEDAVHEPDSPTTAEGKL